MNNYAAHLALLKKRLITYRELIDSWASILPKETLRVTNDYYDDTISNIEIWIRRIYGSASHEEWQILPDIEQYKGKATKSYERVLNRLK